jgi:TRAP-type C4-dicarboxylate transport system substrate-binding protein
MKQPIRLRWVLAHVPYDLFLRSANLFAQKVLEKSQGQIEIEIMGMPEFSEKYLIPAGKPAVTHVSEVIDLVNAGVIEMSQLVNTEMANISRNLSVLEMPFIFKNHDHATRVLDGEIGRELLDDLAKSSNLKGLSFTYSGGFQMVVANEPLTTAKDFEGKRVRTGWTDVASSTFKAVGADPVAVRISETADAIMKDLVDVGENTWARYYRSGLNEVSNFVSETKHSLFLTCIIMNQHVWNQFDSEMQTFMQEAAIEAAVSERLESLADGEQAKKQAIQDGITVYEWKEEDLAQLQKATEVLYDQYKDYFSVGLIDSIKHAGK